MILMLKLVMLDLFVIQVLLHVGKIIKSLGKNSSEAWISSDRLDLRCAQFQIPPPGHYYCTANTYIATNDIVV